MDDDVFDEAWIAAGPPPEEQEESGCLGLVLAVAGVVGASVVAVLLWVIQ